MTNHREDQPRVSDQAPATRPIAGRRRRRLRRAAVLLAGIAAVSVMAQLIAVRLNRPDVRRPGEALSDITDRLARNLPPEAPMPRFTDRTTEAGLDSFITFVGARSSQLPEDMGSGAAWADFDNDGDEDVFLVGAGAALTSSSDVRARSELYENLGDGTFRREANFPETRIMGMAAAWADYNADGWIDLVVSGYGNLLLFRNEHGTFVPDPAIPDRSGYWSGVAWGDFDNDHDLDLYVCGYVNYIEDAGTERRATQQYGSAVPYTLNPASFKPAPNLLFRNDGAGQFVEVAGEYGVANQNGRSLAALWHDFNDDGWLDLYVANDISDNAFFINREGSFEDAGLLAYVADYRGAMGLAVGDWNRDGDDDLFVTHWIAQENALYDSMHTDTRQARQTDVGTTETEPIPLTFTDCAVAVGLGHIALQSVGWGTEFADFDGDGWLDLVVANGSTQEIGETPKRLKPETPMLMWNRHGAYFHDLAPLHGDLSKPHVSRGLALADYDRDGDLDMLIVRRDGGVQLLSNEMQTGNWIQIKLRSRLGPDGATHGHGEGSHVIVHQGTTLLRRSVTTGSYLSQSSRTLHFGLGDADVIDRIDVSWHGGETQRFEGLRANMSWQLTEGDPIPRALVTKINESDEARRERVMAFWAKQRAAMDAVKKEGDLKKAVSLFREALILNPRHEDARYYLANCLAAQGEIDEALLQLEELMRINPSSHRACTQWGVLRAIHAQSADDLSAAAAALDRSVTINREETGALRVLGEIAILRDENELATERLRWVCRTNPDSMPGQFLLGYLAWRADDHETSAAHLLAAEKARGDAWKPEGSVAEGDVAQRLHEDASPLSPYWRSWQGTTDPDRAFQELHAFVTGDRPWRK